MKLLNQFNSILITLAVLNGCNGGTELFSDKQQTQSSRDQSQTMTYQLSSIGDPTPPSEDCGIRYTPIRSYEDLMGMQMNGKYELCVDLDLSTRTHVPIGSEAAPFAGELHGNSHVISGLTLASNDYGRLGLFKMIDGARVDHLTFRNFSFSAPNASGGALAGRILNSQISNVIIENGNITCAVGCGLLAGTLESSDVENCSAGGSVKATLSGSGVGGLVGESIGYSRVFVLRNIHVNANVEGQHAVGGIAGVTYNVTLSNSTFSGSVKGTDDVGGLIGQVQSVKTAYNSATIPTPLIAISRSSSRGTLEGNSRSGFNGYIMGGLAGSLRAGTSPGNIPQYLRIEDSYSLMNILSLDQKVGGLVGLIDAKGFLAGFAPIILNSFNLGSVSAPAAVGGILGCLRGADFECSLANSTQIKNSYFDGDINPTLLDSFSRSEEELHRKATFLGWDFNDLWVLPTDQFPYLKFEDVHAPSAPGMLRTMLVDPKQVALAWFIPSTDDIGVVKYIIQRSIASGDFADIGSVSPSAITFTDKLVSQLRTYQYRVVAIDYSENRSQPSNVVSVTISKAR